MISDAQLRRLARELDVRLGYAEKNYVNSWILWAIYGREDSARENRLRGKLTMESW